MNLSKLYNISCLIVASCLMVESGFCADNRGRSFMTGATIARMPAMPTFSINTMGNTAVQPLGTGTTTATPTPVPTPVPDPVPTCNTSYTIENCMSDVKHCVNTGALPNGLNDMFNIDILKTVVTGGMYLCQAHIDKCIKEVKAEICTTDASGKKTCSCNNVYTTSSDVWYDFNARVVQLEYYNFVLRMTGLSPDQAEGACLIYGTDYARWDPVKAECLVKVIACNKDEQITNKWLFGGAGNDEPAEVWKKTGDVFTCNKDLFGFSLLTKTKTAAVVGIAGGGVLGGALGAGIGAGVYDKNHKDGDTATTPSANPCENEEYRASLGKKIKDVHMDGVLKEFLYKDVTVTGTDAEQKVNGNAITINDWYNLTKDQCEAILNLYSTVEVAKFAVEECENIPGAIAIDNAFKEKRITALNENLMTIEYGTNGNSVDIKVHDMICHPVGEVITQNTIDRYKKECLFKPLAVGFSIEGEQNPYCNHNGMCLTLGGIKFQINKLESVLSQIEPMMPSASKKKELTKGQEIAKDAAIGLATAATAGAIATGITALLERSNISCKAGGPCTPSKYSVGFNKSHTILSLKDIYIENKTTINISSVMDVKDCPSWTRACNDYTALGINFPRACSTAQVKYTDASGKTSLIYGACVISGNDCIENRATAVSHGACAPLP
ncbi:MAG: hypothetical protein MJ158_00730 [Alphaproteobacteria bacterium]|nr:hypothetical protein [Alphaproteobacteria bacterium]